jgi:hypothetical protein
LRAKGVEEMRREEVDVGVVQHHCQVSGIRYQVSGIRYQETCSAGL